MSSGYMLLIKCLYVYHNTVHFFVNESLLNCSRALELNSYVRDVYAHTVVVQVKTRYTDSLRV